MTHYTHTRVVDSRVRTITPADAMSILENNFENRRVSSAQVSRLSAAMRRGSFVGENGETIKISEAGTLIDGQHRLYACVASGKPFRTLVVTLSGTDAAMGVPLDKGMRRRTEDVMGMTAKAAEIAKAMIRDCPITGAHALAQDDEFVALVHSQFEPYIEQTLTHYPTTKKTFAQAPIKAVIALRASQGIDVAADCAQVVKMNFGEVSPKWVTWYKRLASMEGNLGQENRRRLMTMTWVTSNPSRDTDRLIVTDDTIRKTMSEIADYVVEFIGGQAARLSA